MPITIENWISADCRNFRHRKKRIRSALDLLETGMLHAVTEGNREDVFYMLCFCLAVPQSKQSQTEQAIDKLRSLDYYRVPLTVEEISTIFRGKVRFQNRKAEYLVNARRIFFETDFWSQLKSAYESFSQCPTGDRFQFLMSKRDWLRNTFKGMDMKEASHFLRNCGMRGLAILDKHVLTAMLKRGLISEAYPLTKARYYDIEKEVIAYAERLGLEIDELDQLFWSSATGYVGK